MVGPHLSDQSVQGLRMNTILLPVQRPASTVPPHSPRRTDLREILFPVELRALHFLDEKDRPVVLDTHRAVINANTGQHLGVVGAGYRLVTNEEALKFGRQCASELFGAAHSNLEIFNIHTPARPNFCRIDLIHKGYEVNVFRQEVYLPFLRLTNSYNASRALRFDIGYCRQLCLNGVIFESEVIEFRFPHSRVRIPETLDFKLGKERMETIRQQFGARAARLVSHELDARTRRTGIPADSGGGRKNSSTCAGGRPFWQRFPRYRRGRRLRRLGLLQDFFRKAGARTSSCPQ